MRIAGLIPESYVDGPGVRYVVFVQGCSHFCKGCHNTCSWDYTGGVEFTTDEVASQINTNFKYNPLLSGLTLSGGEPFDQVHDVLDIITKCKDVVKSIIMYSGYTLEQLLDKAKNNDDYIKVLKSIDYLVDGEFIEELKSLECHFKGSSNQRIIDMKHYFLTGEIKTEDFNYYEEEML